MHDELWQSTRRRKALWARDLRLNSTDAERHLWRALRMAFPGRRFRRQHPIGPYFADFVCLAAKLVIEVDGGQHTPELDIDRTQFLERRGFRILRFWNNDVLTRTDGVLERIEAALEIHEGGGLRPEPPPSQP